jgi:hypothetical protein
MEACIWRARCRRLLHATESQPPNKPAAILHSHRVYYYSPTTAPQELQECVKTIERTRWVVRKPVGRGKKGSSKKKTYAQRGEEPAVLARCVSLLKELLDRLLGILPLRHLRGEHEISERRSCGKSEGVTDLLESVGRDNTLKALEFECVTGRKEVVVVDRLENPFGPINFFPFFVL